MATTKPKFAGWSFSFDEGEVTGGARRSRRSTASDSKLILKRDEDGLTIKGGDSILVNDPDGGLPLVCLVVDAQIGTDDYIVLRGLNYLRREEVENEPQGTVDSELFLTSVQDQLYVEDIIEKANVLNARDFSSIVIDDSTQDNTFLCRRGYDTYYKIYSDYVDIEEIKKGMANDPANEVEILRNSFVKSLYTEKKPISPKKETTPRAPKTKPSKPPKSKPSSQPKRKETQDHETNGNTKRSRLVEHVVSDFEESDKDAEALENSKKLFVEISDSDDSEEGSKEEESESESESESEEEDLFSDDDEFRPNRKPKGPRAKPTKKYKKRNSRAMGPASLARLQDGDTSKKASDDEPALKKIKTRLNASAEASLASLPCREEQFSQLYLTLESAIESSTGSVVYISGTPGTGKTATVREVIRQLSKQAHKTGENQFNYLEINGMKLLSPQSSYELLWKKLSNEKVSASNIQRELDQYFNNGKTKQPLVVLMDELDQIAVKNQSVMYNFFNWPNYKKSKLILVAVANTMDLPERTFPNKSASRMGLTRIQFPGYTHDDLKKIIHARLEVLDSTDVILTKDAIEFAARKVASVSGDARRALKICRRAVELAEADYKAAGKNSNELSVQILHINRAISETTNSPVAYFISELSFVGKLLLIGILTRKRKSGLPENSLGDVIDEMKQIVTMNSAKDKSTFIIESKSILDILYEDFIIRPQGFAYVLNELIEAGIVLQEDAKSERVSAIKLNIADEEITSVFKKEKSLHYFIDLITTE